MKSENKADVLQDRQYDTPAKQTKLCVTACQTMEDTSITS